MENLVNVEFTQGIVLHKRKYKESSFLVTFWLKPYGKVQAVARGSKKSQLYQSFSLLSLSVKLPKHADGLATVLKVEQENFYPSGSYLSQLSRLYINELLYWLLPCDHHDERLFNQYLSVIKLLVDNEVSAILRYFELGLLESLGYGFQCDYDQENNPIESNKTYLMQPLSAFYLANTDSGIKGGVIQKISQPISSWTSQELNVVRQLIRVNLEACLQGRKLRVRELLVDYLKQRN